ncbi:hypothetical protein FH972_026715 [Carpinus fangiana]|uniref:Uncharacterized protein n=1 Tax=Carpinus fangiana TaxID=176857 RepID=A0A5N6L4U6_9ROSI|nr:hypothetical protein FH972_026715 [Carpinus fangiana]
MLLVLAQPRLLRLTHHALRHKVHHQSNNNQDKGDGVHPVHREVEDLNADDDAPEVGSQQANVEKGRACQAEHEGRQRVKERQDERVAGEVAADLGGPDGGAEGVTVKDGGDDTHDGRRPEGELADDLVEGPLRDQKLLKHVGQAVEGGAGEGEEVALELVAAVADAGAVEVVGAQQDAHAADADDDAGVLGDAVAHAEHEEGDDDDDDNGPEVDQLGAQDAGVAVGEDEEVVAHGVEEAQDQVAPALGDQHAGPLLEAVAVDGVGGVDEIEQDVVEQGLEGGDRGVGVEEQAGESVGARDAQRKDLPVCVLVSTGSTVRQGNNLPEHEHDPELARLDVRKPAATVRAQRIQEARIVWAVCPAEKLRGAMLGHIVVDGRRRPAVADVLDAVVLHGLGGTRGCTFGFVACGDHGRGSQVGDRFPGCGGKLSVGMQPRGEAKEGA